MRFLHRRHWRAAYAGRIADSGLARIRASRYDQAPGSELGRGNLNRRPSTGIAVMVANVAMRTSRVVIVGARQPSRHIAEPFDGAALSRAGLYTFLAMALLNFSRLWQWPPSQHAEAGVCRDQVGEPVTGRSARPRRGSRRGRCDATTAAAE